ncbi:hypothetical protein [Longimicrobium sp.]|uniref:hypothetical protein n=1 Tax=Longimicrobium sp. TaxID=2029185 RepID=UPI002E372A6B|nr:hypothetical protein [Longimicrobium sp.]HEX6038319.1 hypothetical protein [Longimicrobium sp.]
MNPTIHRIRRVVPLAALLLALPACAQRTGRSEHRESHGETWVSINDHDGYRSELRATGDVRFNEEGDWVTSVAPGASLTVSERGRGQDRRIEFRPGDGGVRTRYWVRDDERPLDAAGRAWARGMIADAVRNGGLGAEGRVATLRERGGVSAVLSEIGRIESDTGRRAYYLALLRGAPVSNAEFARVMADVGRRMGSDTETRLVLNEAVDHADGVGRLAALLDAAVGMESDTETRLVLNHVAQRRRLEDAASRAAFFRAVGGMESDTETRLVLNAVADQRLAEGEGREAFFGAVNGIGSDVERRLVLSSVLDDEPSEATVVAALRSAGAMDSDMEKRLVLMQVPSSMLRSQRVTAAYRQVVEAMDSDTERGLALRRLAGGRR